MKGKRKWGVALLLALVLIAILISNEKVQPVGENPEASKVVFFVS